MYNNDMAIELTIQRAATDAGITPERVRQIAKAELREGLHYRKLGRIIIFNQRGMNVILARNKQRGRPKK
jgi:hypothetical protein